MEPLIGDRKRTSLVNSVLMRVTIMTVSLSGAQKILSLTLVLNYVVTVFALILSLRQLLRLLLTQMLMSITIC